MITPLKLTTDDRITGMITPVGWTTEDLITGMIAVNTGDMLEMASHGYLPSTTHRVINPVGADSSRPRLSMPLFLHPRDDVLLNEKITAHEYLQERLREIGLR